MTLATKNMHTYEVRPRKDKHGVDLISDALPFGRLWYLGSARKRRGPSGESGTRSLRSPRGYQQKRRAR